MQPRRVVLVLSAMLFLVALTAAIVRTTAGGGDAEPSADTPAAIEEERPRPPNAVDPAEQQPSSEPGVDPGPPGSPGQPGG